MNIKRQFIRYVSQNMLGMLGMSLYILADTFFIAKAVGANGITALNLVLPLYNLIFAVGAMIGVGSAIRFTVERNKGTPFLSCTVMGSSDQCPVCFGRSLFPGTDHPPSWRQCTDCIDRNHVYPHISDVCPVFYVESYYQCICSQ